MAYYSTQGYISFPHPSYPTHQHQHHHHLQPPAAAAVAGAAAPPPPAPVEPKFSYNYAEGIMNSFATPGYPAGYDQHHGMNSGNNSNASSAPSSLNSSPILLPNGLIASAPPAPLPPPPTEAEIEFIKSEFGELINNSKNNSNSNVHIAKQMEYMLGRIEQLKSQNSALVMENESLRRVSFYHQQPPMNTAYLQQQLLQQHHHHQQQQQQQQQQLQLQRSSFLPYTTAPSLLPPSSENLSLPKPYISPTNTETDTVTETSHASSSDEEASANFFALLEAAKSQKPNKPSLSEEGKTGRGKATVKSTASTSNSNTEVRVKRKYTKRKNVDKGEAKASIKKQKKGTIFVGDATTNTTATPNTNSSSSSSSNNNSTESSAATTPSSISPYNVSSPNIDTDNNDSMVSASSVSACTTRTTISPNITGFSNSSTDMKPKSYLRCHTCNIEFPRYDIVRKNAEVDSNARHLAACGRQPTEKGFACKFPDCPAYAVRDVCMRQQGVYWLPCKDRMVQHYKFFHLHGNPEPWVYQKKIVESGKQNKFNEWLTRN